jgi:glycosyltransferase involved in cell wall biosynthesis
MSDQHPISLVFLAYNEASTIEEEILTFYHAIVNKLPGSEFIIAEDGSTDGTTEIIKRLVESLGIIHVSGGTRKGYARALADAVDQAKNQYVFLSDTGLKYYPDDFWRIYQHRESYDLIVGRRVGRQDQIYRRFLTYFYNLFLREWFQVKAIHDCDSGFRLFNRKVINDVFGKGLEFRNLVGSEIVLKSTMRGLTYAEVPVRYCRRGDSSRGMPIKNIHTAIFEVLKNLRKLKRDLGRDNERHGSNGA